MSEDEPALFEEADGTQRRREAELIRQALQRSHAGRPAQWDWYAETAEARAEGATERAADGITGSDVSFETFYRVEQPRLVGFLISLGARPADAPDIAQQTMEKAHKQWAVIEHHRAWIRRVASRDWFRQVARTREEPVSEVEEHSSVQATTSDIDALVRRLMLDDMMASLSPRQRQVFAWTYDAFTPAEIAAELDMTPQQVSRDLWRARRKLQAQLGEEGDPA